MLRRRLSDRQRKAMFAALAAAGLLGVGALGGRGTKHLMMRTHERAFGVIKGTKRVTSSQRALAQRLGVTGKELSGVRRVNYWKAPAGAQAGDFTARVKDGRLMLGGYNQSGTLSMYRSGPSAVAKHEVGHSIWNQLPLLYRSKWSGKISRTKAGKNIAKKGYRKKVHGTEGFAEIYRVHRGSSYGIGKRAAKMNRATRNERRLLANALRELRKVQRGG